MCDLICGDRTAFDPFVNFNFASWNRIAPDLSCGLLFSYVDQIRCSFGSFYKFSMAKKLHAQRTMMSLEYMHFMWSNTHYPLKIDICVSISINKLYAAVYLHYSTGNFGRFMLLFRLCLLNAKSLVSLRYTTQ